MTTGASLLRAELYFYRALLNENFPGLVVLDAQHKPDIQPFLDRGAAVVKEASPNSVFQLVPDSVGLSAEELEKMPEYIRGYRCNRASEKGEPCASYKWDSSICQERRFRTGWHPGWKAQALRGNMLALVLMEILSDSLDDVEAASDRRLLLRDLVAQEESDRNKFLNSDLPPLHSLWFPGLDGSVADEARRIMYRNPNVCHIAQVPSEVMYKGLLNEHNHTADSSKIRLVEIAADRQPWCPVELNIDHEDYFEVTPDEGYREMTVPNDGTAVEYAAGMKLRGMVAICFYKCPSGRCPPLFVRQSGIADKKLEMDVNGKPVSSLLQLVDQHRSPNCFLLAHSDGVFFDPNPDGRFTIRLRVLSEGKNYTQISSFVVW